MPQSFREPPIPTHEVVVTHDGSVVGSLDLPDAMGDRTTCMEFICTHAAPTGCDLDIRHIESGRLVSYILPARLPGQRIFRLSMQDLA